MADDQLATRAPENDAAEATSVSNPTDAPTESPIPSDTLAQEGPTMSMSEHCTSDRPTPASALQPSGEFTTLKNVSCYVSRPASYPQEPGKLLLLLTGGTGIKSVNNQLQADAYAARGFLVVMPDQFGGDTAPNIGVLSEDEVRQLAENEQSTSTEGRSLLERIKMGAAEAVKSLFIDFWLARHTPEKVLPRCQNALEGAREAFADAVANGGGVYGVGYCFGAKYILLLCGAGAKADNVTKSEQDAAAAEGDAGKDDKKPELKAGAIAHGTLITHEDIEGVTSPISMVCVADDNLFPNEVREQGRATLELNAVDHEIEIFHDVPHGFAVVGDYAEERIKEKQAKAFEMMCTWLEKD